MKTLLMKFAGPLQSWGTSSHFETRHTDFHPSKSAVIGMISAALGYSREDDINIQKLNELDFAVRVDQRGSLLRDFHIAQKYKVNGDLERNYVTQRYYLEDAVFVVGIGHKDVHLIDEIVEALKNPFFQLYLGKRALPVNADFIIKVKDLGVMESIRSLPWQAANWYRKKNKIEKLKIYSDASLVKGEFGTRRRDKVMSFSHKERKFGFRFESKTDIKLRNLKKSSQADHDAFEAIGGQDVFVKS